MNIEQLNGNGQHLWVFITTAVVTLAVTGGSWWAIEQINSYRRWRRRRYEDQYDGNTSFTVAVRLALIAELMFTRPTKCWTFKSGAWWRIMVNHSSRVVIQRFQERLNTCEFLSKYGNNSWLWNGPLIYWESAV